MEEMISDKRLEYEKLCARISAGKASQQEAVGAIRNLCLDNERLAVLLGNAKARALEPAPDLAELVEAAKPFALLDETDDSIGDFCEKHPVEGGYVADLRAALTKLGVR